MGSRSKDRLSFILEGVKMSVPGWIVIAGILAVLGFIFIEIVYERRPPR